jgi:soluble lytic murein transglycosylase-like protein
VGAGSTPSAEDSQGSLPSGAIPGPSAPIPTRPGPLADRVLAVDRALDRAIDAWIAQPGPPARPPSDVALLGLYEQRVGRMLARRPGLLAAVVHLLPRPVAAEVRTNANATADLLSLLTPSRDAPELVLGPPTPIGDLLRWYGRAERRFGVGAELLAAIHLIETKFSRVRSHSSAGAQGPMQFIPSTWAAYGLGGDVRDDRDAIMGAANYLRASGAPQDLRGALFAYNHATPYVDAVLAYARRMARDPRALFGYYSWQVYGLTTEGDVRLSGPGADRFGG